jgi:hypothetical protein
MMRIPRGDGTGPLWGSGPRTRAKELVELGEEEWVAPEPVRVRMENALVLNVERVSLMKSERRVTL